MYKNTKNEFYKILNFSFQCFDIIGLAADTVAC